MQQHQDTTSTTVDISLSQSFDTLSMDEDFMNFLLDGSAAVQPAAAPSTSAEAAVDVPLAASIKTEVLESSQDPHLSSCAVDPFAFNDEATLEEQQQTTQPPQPTAIYTTTATTHLPPSPPSLPSEGLSSPGLDDPFAGLTDIFPILGDLGDSTPSTSTTTSTSTSPSLVPTFHIKEEPLAATIKKEEQHKDKSKRKTSSPATSSKKKKKTASRAAKKQKTESGSTSSSTTGVSDFIESLRGMNSAQLEHYAETQTLTETQQAELKEWIRKIKNRESASLSRQNRKNHQQELETQIEALDTSNSRLKEQITELQIENRVLKKELDDFKALIEKSNLGQAFALYNNTKKASAPQGAPQSESQVKPAAAAPPTPATPASGGGIQLSDVILKAMSGGKPNKEGMALVLYLLMALHSYGQYWNAVTSQHQLSLSQSQPQPDEVTVQA